MNSDEYDDATIPWHEYRPDEQQRTKRKLLITTDNFLPRWDGITRFLSEIIPRLRDHYEITVVAPDYGHVQIDGVTIEKIPLSSRTFGDYTPAKFAYNHIKRLVHANDIVFNQALGPIGVCAIRAAKSCRRPIASYIHSVEWELFPKAIAAPLLRGPLVAMTKIGVRIIYNKCTLLILPSENIAEQFSWRGVRTQKRIAHLGVDIQKFTPGNRAQVRDQLGIAKDALVIGYHGRIAHEKNLITLVRAFSRIRHKNKRLLIVGDGVLGIKSRLEHFPNVTVTGTTHNVIPWLQAMDIYVQPSFTETTSLSVLEAMACQLPVVSSKVGFIKYYLLDGQNGLFFDQRNAYDLGVKLEYLAKNPALRDALARNARATIEKSFTWKEAAQQVIDALDSI